jgi:NAD(P)-dependent dehydrogenase (short-subunit alcohol dehydrogenase family)
MLFSGKSIIVTGASGDLGAAITQRLVMQGGHVLAVDFNTAGLSRLAAEVTGPGVLETFIADVSDKQVLGYATHAFELWGQVDGFVNNAGIQTQVRPIVEFPEEDFDRVMAVNIRGVFLGMKYVLPRMREGGSVVNMSSALGLVGGAGIIAYIASKHAIIGMTKTAALEQGSRGIRVPQRPAPSPAI